MTAALTAEVDIGMLDHEELYEAIEQVCCSALPIF